VAELFSEPDPAWAGRLASPEVAGELAGAAATLGIDAGVVRGVFRRLADPDAIAEERARLLGHTVRSACPPYELEYSPSEVFQQSQSLADVAGFYHAFGLRLDGPLAERPDHIVPQWEFLGLLAFMEWRAGRDAQAEGVESCRSAARAFIKDHAATWMFAWFTRVRRESPDGLLAAACDVAEAVLRDACRSFGLSAGPAWLELRPVGEEDSTISCGAAGGGQVELGPRLAQVMEERAGC
jgi:TorA maturation chaperone TorD